MAKKTTNRKSRSKASSTTDSSSQSSEVLVRCDNFTLQWSQQELSTNYIIDQPQFKFCKKRKEFFSNEYEEIWYKSPYKYNMRMKVTSTVPCFSDDLVTMISVSHEDGSVVKSKTDTITFTAPVPQKRRGGKKAAAAATVDTSSSSSSESDSDEDVATPKPKTPTCHHEIKLGPFQFNVCSYKYDGKKFRLMIHLSTRAGQQICCLTSPAFLIKAKKPIVKPGIKSKKRSHDEMSSDSAPATKSTKRSRKNSASATPTTPELPSVPLALPSLPTLPAFQEITAENFDAQKKLVEEQLLQFGMMLNNLMNGTVPTPQQTMYDNQFMSREVVYPADQVMNEAHQQPETMVTNDHFMQTLAQFMPLNTGLQHMSNNIFGNAMYLPQQPMELSVQEEAAAYMMPSTDSMILSHSTGGDPLMYGEEFDLFAPDVKSEAFELVISPKQPMVSDDIFLL